MKRLLPVEAALAQDMTLVLTNCGAGLAPLPQSFL
jgi:hypothetical protein